eukprot:symbB.v1.2.029188.t1/scaffold3168.1/size62061/1
MDAQYREVEHQGGDLVHHFWSSSTSKAIFDVGGEGGFRTLNSPGIESFQAILRGRLEIQGGNDSSPKAPAGG